MEKKGRPLAGAAILVVLLALAGTVVVGGGKWKNNLTVQSVRTRGNSIISSAEVIALAGIQKNERLFSADILGAQRRVSAHQFVKSAAVNRDAPDRITVTVVERKPVAALALDNVLYLDAEGVVLPAMRSENIFDLPVITGTLNPAECAPGKRVTSAPMAEALAILADARTISDELYRLISEIHLDGERDIVLVTAESGVPVVFGRGGGGEKLLKFDAFWKEYVSARGAQDLKYVDLRFDGEVVARWKTDDPAQPQ